MVVSKRIQILNRQFNTLNSNANFYFNYVACVSCKCFKYKLLVAIRKRQCSILVCLVHLKRIIEKSKNRMPVSMSLVFWAGMHGRGSRPSTPASNATGCDNTGGTPQTARPCRVVPCGCSRLALTRLKSSRLGPYRLKPPKWPVQAETAESGRNSKKKKKKKKRRCKTHRLDLT